MEIEKGATDKRSVPHMVIEVIADVSRVRRLLLFYNLENQTDDADDNRCEQKELFVCNHLASPLSLLGGAEVPSVRRSITAYRIS